MNTFTGVDFMLTYGMLIQVRVTPTNNKGTGPASEMLTFGATIRTVPFAPAMPYRGLMTNEYKIQVDWVPIIITRDRGNSPILSYRLWWDSQTGTTSITLVEGMLFSYTIVGLLSHAPYKFRVQARNIYGYGALSDEVTITTTDVPHIMDPVVTAQFEDDVKLTWTEPLTGGNSILDYTVKLFIPVTKEFVEDPNCKFADPSIKECTFTMNYLEDTYQFKYGELIQAMAKARNIRGSNEYSSVNNEGAIALTRPAFMYPVTEGSLTVKETIHLLWETITLPYHIGGAPILNYVIDWDQGGYTWVELVTLPASPISPNEHLVTGLVNNKTHKFKIRAQNKYGLGAWSEISFLRPTGVPEGISPIETNLYGTNVYIEW